MYQLVILPRSDNPNLPAISLSYKGSERAMKALKRLQDTMAGKEGVIDINDDYGYVSVIRCEDILHILYIDVEQSEVQRLDKNLTLAKVSKKLLERVNKDPEERTLLQTMMNSTSAPAPARSNIIQ